MDRSYISTWTQRRVPLAPSSTISKPATTRDILLRRLAVSSPCGCSLLFAVLPARTARQPRYGGTLHVAFGVALASLDPAISATTSHPQDLYAIRDQIDSLLTILKIHRDSGGSFWRDVGSGPFTNFFRGNREVACSPRQANDNFRDGRPFAGRDIEKRFRVWKFPLRDRLLDLELGKSDLTEIPAQDARHAAERGIRISQSQPDELLAVVFLGYRGAW